MSWLRKHKILLGLILFFLLIQYKLWFANGGLLEVKALKDKVSIEKQKVAVDKKRNKVLLGQVHNIKADKEAVEAHARTDLGMVKPGEEYLQVIDQSQLRSAESSEVVDENSPE
jgi:cell division protein FtsB